LKNWYAPPPGSKSGVADYAEKLGAEIGEVRQPVYHIGNNSLHGEIYDRALREPGTVILHDAVLHHFLLGRLSEAAYVDEFAHNYGEWMRPAARRLYARRADSGADPRYFAYPMLKRLCEAARVIVVHNPEAAAIVQRESGGKARIEEIPHFVDLTPEVDSTSVFAWRERHGFAPGECVFGVFGYLRETKRLHVVLRGARMAGVRVLMQGEFAAGSSLEQSLGLPDPAVVRVGHLDEAEFALAAASCDVGVNLRYPGAGETSGVAMRLMAMGKPLIVTASEAWARFPPGVLAAVRPGPGEAEHLAELMRWFRQNPVGRREMGRRARIYLAAEHALPLVAARLRAIVDG
jgi:glycosyltransferase involved in cell wall biosynthesis